MLMRKPWFLYFGRTFQDYENTLRLVALVIDSGIKSNLFDITACLGQLHDRPSLGDLEYFIEHIEHNLIFF